MVTLNRNDLTHILEQIRIAEEHTRLINGGADPRAALESLVSSPLLPFGLRTVDGAFNNFQPGMTHFGSADQPMLRLLTPVFGPAGTNPFTGLPTSYAQTSGTVYDSGPRMVSNLVADQSLNNPAAIAAALAANGVTGAAQLEVVGRIMEAQRAARSLTEAIALAEAEAAAAVAAAQVAVDAAAQDVDAAQSVWASAAATAGAAAAALADAQARMDAAQAALAAAPAGGGVLAAVAALVAAQAATAQAQTDAAAASTVLANAQAGLAAAQTMLAQLQAARDMAASAAAEADAAVVAAQAALDAAQEAVDTSLADPAAVIAAQAEVDAAESALATATATAAAAAEALAAAQAAVAAQQAIVDAAQAAVDSAAEALAAAEQAAAETQAALDQATADLAAADQAVQAAAAAYIANPGPATLAAMIAAGQAAQAAQAAYDAAAAADAQADAESGAAADALAEALLALAEATPALAPLQAAVAAAEAAEADAAAAVALAQAALSDAQAVLQQAIDAVAGLAQAIEARDAALAALTAAQAAAANAAEDHALAQAAVDAQADVVAGAQDAVDAAAASAAAAQATLADRQAALAAAQAALTDAALDEAARVAALQEVVDARAALDVAVADAGAANATLAMAQAALAAAQAALAAATDARDAIPTGAEAVAVAQAAAAAAQEAVLDLLAENGVEMDGDNVFIPNVAADLGDTAPFNGFMTIFGQFFDHGLDLTSKGGGTVIIPLQPDDPLYVPGSPTNFMVLTRATNQPGPDGIPGTADDVRDHNNETTPWIDLNQVYTSNASHQVFLREYTMVDGKPVATGHMLESAKGGPPTWADVKEQARTMLGIELHDLNVHSVPLLVTDLYGAFVRGPNGFPQMMTLSGPVEGNPASPVSGLAGLSAGRAFLNDIAHSAAPSGPIDHDRNPATPMVEVLPDDDDVAGNHIPVNMFGFATTYDNELLDAHYIVGDGRGNENIALTAVHTIFHSEHNRQVDAIKAQLLAEGDVAFLNEWLAVPVGAIPADPSTLIWNGERLFQAARFSTEMVYQHLVFEEFVRAIAPQIDPFVFSHSVEIDGAIFAEFAQVVYRFGHSMLNEKVALLPLVNGAAELEEVGLIEAFLNPIAFDNAGVDAAAAAGSILRGMTRQVGNEIDEFMTSALRNNLVGLPLDLAALNIARARETGIPSLNEARRQFFEQTQDSYLKPYESWSDFAGNIKNPLSVVNFIAAYGTHESVVNAVTAQDKRDAAWALVFGGDNAPADRLDFLNSRGAWAGLETGLNRVDFWIGGLAEALMPFGGMLGSTFTFVFEMQIENLQAGDRFYYLSRTQGMNLLTQLESDSFANLIRRNTDTKDIGLHVNGAAFQTADYVLEMNQALQWNPGLGNQDPTRAPDVLTAITGTTLLVERRDVDGDGDVDYIRYHGGEHVVIGGTAENDTIIGGAGDDGLWGEGGDDDIEGGFGVDHIFGGAGDDVITDSGTDIGDADVIKGEAGDDVINAGMGLDLVFGGSGNDVLTGGSEAKDIFGGEGDDFIRAPSGGGFILGNEGHDWMEGRGFMVTLTGDNSELFFNSRIIGHDVMLAGENDTDFDAESGDDIMVQGIGINRNNGMAGFDWVTYQHNNYAAHADMNVGIFVNQQNNILRDRFDLVEGLSGWGHSDVLIGRNTVVGGYDPNGNAAQVAADAPIESFSNALLEKNLGLISGLADLVAHLERFDLTHPAGTTNEVLRAVMDTSDGSDIILGGGGSDTITGGAGNDILDGDRFLQVMIGINDRDGNPMARATGLTGQVIGADGQPMFGGRTLESLLFDRSIKPSQLHIVREIVDGGQAGDIDVATYWDVMANYDITYNPGDGSFTITHVTATAGVIDPATGRNRPNEGTDRLRNIELVTFADGQIVLADLIPHDTPATGAPTISDLSPTIGEMLTAGVSGIVDPDGIASIGLRWQESSDGGTTWTDIPGATGTSFTPSVGQRLDTLRVVAVVTDLNGNVTTLASGATGLVGDRFIGTAGANTIVGTAGSDFISGGLGADSISAGAGDDVISWNAGVLTADGRDTVDGGAGHDTFVVNGSDLAEAFRIYTTAAWQALGGNRAVAAGTEIVITRNGTANTNVIAELRNVEEIVINTNGGFSLANPLVDGDTVQIFGDFTGTSLSFNTIAVTGSNGNDVIDISGLASAHRILFRTGGGNDLIVGTVRAQDVIEAAPGVDPAAYVVSHDPQTGLVTLTAPGSTISFTGNPDALPEIRACAIGGVQRAGSKIENGSSAHELIEGNATADVLSGGGGNDTIRGGEGNDLLRGQNGRDVLEGGAGNDRLIDGQGADMLFGGDGNDDLRLVADQHIDHVFGGAGIDTVRFQGTREAVAIDLGGVSGIGTATVGGVTDFLVSVENAVGGAGNDTLTASDAVNRLTGGAGRDIFRFLTETAAHGDTITDFQPGDIVDLSGIDARRDVEGDQAFVLLTQGATPAAGVLQVADLGDGRFAVSGFTDEDDQADFTLFVRATRPLTAEDFNL